MIRTPFFFRSPPRSLVLVIGWSVLLGLGLGDLLFRPYAPFLVLYLIPVCYVAWSAGSLAGYSMVVGAAVLRLVTNYLQPAGAPAMGDRFALLRQSEFLAMFPAFVFLLTRLKRAQEELTRRLRERTTQLAAAEDTERRRLATELHDSVNQTLCLLKINLTRSAANGTENQSRQAGMQESLHLLDEAIRQTRTVMFDLYPVMLDDLGLAATLMHHGERLSARTDTRITVSETGDKQLIDFAEMSFLYRACTELLTNAIKHGQAKEIVVTILWQPSVLRIIIDDDGCGFDPKQSLPAQREHGLGLAGIRERLLSLGGQLLIDSKAGEGARLIMEVTLDPRRGDRQIEDSVPSPLTSGY